MPSKELMKKLCEIGAIKVGEFTVKSGRRRLFNVDLRILSFFPEVLLSHDIWHTHELGD